MEKGIVKWFNDKKGFGFITREKGDDIFVHFNSLSMEGFKTLKENERVIFDVQKTDKGEAAVNVRTFDDEIENIIEHELLALGLFGDKVRLVSLSLDGKCSFIDGSKNLHNILYITSSETLELQRAVEELESLVNDANANEEDFQKFFEENPDFILNDDYKKAHPHIVLTKENDETLIPDFVLEPVEQNSLSDILELKLPSSQVYVLKKSRMRYSAAVLEACAQLREYSMFFDEEKNRNAVYKKYNLRAYKPKMFVIIGRCGNVNPIQKRQIQSDTPNIHLKTYDDIISRMKARIDSMKRGTLIQ